MPTILISLPSVYLEIAPEVVSRLIERGFTVRTRTSRDEDGAAERLADLVQECDALVVASELVGVRTLQAAARLRLIVKHGAGYDNIDVAEATRRSIAVAYVPGANALAVAELTVGLMIACARHLCEADAVLKGGRWQEVLGVELAGKVLGIVGTGRIGRLVALRARAFGMTVLGYDIVQDAVFAAQAGLRYAALPELLQAADIVSIHVPLTPQTRGLLSEPQLRLMKRDAILVHVARGGVVDERALYRALVSRHLRAVAIDAWRVEPVVGHELMQLSNVIATPHLGGSTVEAAHRLAVGVSDAVLKFFAGSPPEFMVNPDVWTSAHLGQGGSAGPG